MSNIRSEDLKIITGVEAYEAWTGKKVKNKGLSIIHETYFTAVYIEHIPTGTRAYCNDYESHIKNRDKALSIIMGSLLNDN